MSIQVVRRPIPTHAVNAEASTIETPWEQVIRRVYANRGITEASQADLSMQYLLPPQSLLQIDAASELLFTHIQQQSSIVIVGDYDADGATSTALAIRGLSAMGATQLNYIVPDRFLYGYGLTPEIVALTKQFQPDLIITVDNGISSIAGVAAAQEAGIQVLVTDHHLPGSELPAADVILNPNQPGDQFASKALAGVGVMFYLLVSLRALMRKQGWFEAQGLTQPNLADYLDLVALGTVADVVTLDQNNRILVEQGLRRIRAGQSSVGIKALLHVANIEAKRCSASDLGFYVGPRINAAGRLEDMAMGIACLLTDDANQAQEIAQTLHDLNSKRREIEGVMKEQALKDLAALNELDLAPAKNNKATEALGICMYRAEWHQGVIGILAGRIKEKTYRPTIAFADGDQGEIKGSARSIPGVHIRDVLDTVAARNPGLINKFGGHAMAAGLTLASDRYEEFAAAYQQVLADWIKPEDLQAQVLSDGELSVQELNLATAKGLRNAGPWGQGFPMPIFDTDFIVTQHRILAEKHLKLTLKADLDAAEIEAIWFNFDHEAWSSRAHRVHLAFELDVNFFRGIESAQLMIRHLRVSETH